METITRRSSPGPKWSVAAALNQAVFQFFRNLPAHLGLLRRSQSDLTRRQFLLKSYVRGQPQELCLPSVDIRIYTQETFRNSISSFFFSDIFPCAVASVSSFTTLQTIHDLIRKRTHTVPRGERCPEVLTTNFMATCFM